MTAANPLLESDGLPRFSTIRPAHVEPAVDAALADYRARIDALLASDAPRDFASVVLLGEELEDRLNRIWAPVSHLHGVADSEALRKAYSAAQGKIVEHASELGQKGCVRYADAGRMGACGEQREQRGQQDEQAIRAIHGGLHRVRLRGSYLTLRNRAPFTDKHRQYLYEKKSATLTSSQRRSWTGSAHMRLISLLVPSSFSAPSFEDIA
jgi:Zn-dependent oligopeptidase